ncbi:DUF987 family protein [Serratia fonticola]|uniref:DUF987 family protein n=1 Tax=Serratia fonticola TaxID=47917 RepID=UPI001378FB2F|nr:DUF987 family protein [Serratia fonticola]NCG54061.1 DUF987 family protein [Serratia fonticola]
MKIVTKAEAMRIRDRALQAGESVAVMSLDGNKYKWTGRAADYLGEELVNVPGVLAVYVESRRDLEGTYAKLMCVSEQEQEM